MTGPLPKRSSPAIGLLHPRIVLMCCLLPITVAVGFLVVFCVEMFVEYSYRFERTLIPLIGCWLPALVLFGGTVAIWATAIRWTSGRALGVGALAAAGAIWEVGVLVVCRMDFDDDLVFPFCIGVNALFIAAAIALFAYITWTPPEQPHLDAPVPCPQCGADLRGLTACRCNECGCEFTLAQLVETTRVADAIGITSSTGGE